MFFHVKELQYTAKPDRPDPLFAKKLQEVLGGQWGEMTVAMQYLFQGWNCRASQKYRDMLMDIGTEELAHVEMLVTMIAQLLEGAPLSDKDVAVEQHPVLGAVLGGMNPQHAIVAGLGGQPVNSVGVPWNAAYMTASGNLMADFRLNVTAESMGRLQVTRLYSMTEDAGVRDFLSFLIARDTMHQNQWLAAIADLEEEGLGGTPVPISFPQEKELQAVSYQFHNCSRGQESADGRWAKGETPDGKGQFEFVAEPRPRGQSPELGAGDPRLHGTAKKPVEPTF